MSMWHCTCFVRHILQNWLFKLSFHFRDASLFQHQPVFITQVHANFPIAAPNRQVSLVSQLVNSPPANIAQSDLLACNAVIQVVDRLLLPVR